jgi:tRNA-dihydrouridine synthase 1
MADTEKKLAKKKLKKEKKEKKEKKSKKKNEKKEKKSKRKHEDETKDEPLAKKCKDESVSGTITAAKSKFSFPIQYILAPMVGASELPFRLLCRKYGAQTAYTPMMSSTRFASDAQYRKEEFQTIPEDRPLVCHFSANDPTEFTEAAVMVQDKCDAIDLNLGCPQRTAFVEHFGSYLLDEKDRELICDIVRMASRNVSVPIFCKIRLLNTIEDTIQLCQQLKDAGASLIAIHARYRASFERKGAGARDGAAKLDHILKVRQALGPDFPLIANGNVMYVH